MSAPGRDRLAAALRSLAPLVGLVVTWAFFAALAGSTFMGLENQRLMLLQTAVVGSAAVGATVVIVSGGLDLSVGSMIALGTVVIALVSNLGAPLWLAVACGLLMAACIGAVIGTIVIGHVIRVTAVGVGLGLGAWAWSAWGAAAGLALGLLAAAALLAAVWRASPRLELSPFIVTLGMWGSLRGLAKGIANEQPVYFSDRAAVAPLQTLMSVTDSWLGAPPGVWVTVALALTMAGVLRYTVFGRHVYAIGSNEATARLCGVAIGPSKVLIYTIGALCAGVASALQVAYLSIGDPTTAEGYELQVIAAVVIGGASLSGGQGTIRGTLIGALIMTVVDNGCTKIGLSNWTQQLVTGGIIVAAVALDRWRQRGSA